MTTRSYRIEDAAHYDGRLSPGGIGTLWPPPKSGTIYIISMSGIDVEWTTQRDVAIDICSYNGLRGKAKQDRAHADWLEKTGTSCQ